MGRYAQGTSVPMERSRAEIERTLVRYGASGFAYAWERRALPYPHPSDCPTCKGTRRDPCDPTGRRRCGRFPWNAPDTIEREVVVVGSKMKLDGREREVRLEVPMPHEVEVGTKVKAEAATRQRWRALVLVLKAKLEAVASGISTLESEFLAGIVLPSGLTLGQVVLPRLSEAVSTGRLLPPASTEDLR
ncbi:hypothetical protein [Anaeromyxobacter oryzisoli]|uniref:hypothetical protein n=1 Tax=Anaeromyxobacter oryzisoli TaxID=2925408 RepID=UPI001F56109D|nr:hypothetical protein [Anaeromyxobacter sp. SG63]